MILESIADGVFTIDRDFIVRSFNRAAEEITGVPREEAIGQPCCEVFRAEICERMCALKQTELTGKPVVNRLVYIVRADGSEIPISVSAMPLKDEHGTIVGGVETFRDLTQVEEFRKQLERSFSFRDMLSQNRRMQELFELLPQIAESESTVLVEGETGTGKELMARALHDLSPRNAGPLVAVNCGALPDTLLESELFGYVAGAFTDARRDKAGRFAQADGGTLFLDEIGDISPALQVKLLRVLQEGVYEPLGSVESVTANVRIIAAANQNLEVEVEAGRFRQDLYYRINVICLTVPPLRDRREDIPLLADHFINRFNNLRGRDIAGLSRDALNAFMRHDWPGNVRELENAIEHAFILCPGGLIAQAHLPEKFHAPHLAHPPATTLEEIEAQAIHHALVRNNWKRKATAEELGVCKSTLWRKIKRFGIEVPERKTVAEAPADS